MIGTKYLKQMNNYEKPFSRYWDFTDFIYISARRYIRNAGEWKWTSILDSKGFPFKPAIKDVIFQLYDKTISYSDRDSSITLCESKGFTASPMYFSIVHHAGGSVYTYTRKYLSIAEALGQVGGLRSTLVLLSWLLYKLIGKGSRDRALVEGVFNLKIKDKGCLDCACCQKKKKKNKKKTNGVDSAEDNADNDQMVTDSKTASYVHKSLKRTLDISNIVRELSLLKLIGLSLISATKYRLAPWAILNSDVHDIKAAKLAKEQAKRRKSSGSDKIKSPNARRPSDEQRPPFAQPLDPSGYAEAPSLDPGHDDPHDTTEVDQVEAQAVEQLQILQKKELSRKEVFEELSNTVKYLQSMHAAHDQEHILEDPSSPEMMQQRKYSDDEHSRGDLKLEEKILLLCVSLFGIDGIFHGDHLSSEGNPPGA